MSKSSCESAHYVVTAHPPGGVLITAKCNFLSPHSQDVLLVKSRRLEVRQLRSSTEEATSFSSTTPSSSSSGQSPFPAVLSIPINGRITSLIPLENFGSTSNKTYVFLTTDRLRYAVISYNANATPYPIDTHASGSLKGADHNIVGRQAECGILVAVDRWSRCIAVHLYDGLLTFLPIISGYKPPSLAGAIKGSAARSGAHASTSSILGEPFHARIEERTVLAMTFLQTTNEALPHICLLHQDARSAQHVTTHVVELSRKQLILHGNHSATTHLSEWLKKSRVDGGSSALIPIPPRVHVAAAAAARTTVEPSTTTSNNNKSTSGGVIVLGQRQITYISLGTTKVIPIPPSLLLTWTEIPADADGQFRYLLGDEFGNLHMLTLLQAGDRVHGMQLDTLGSCTLSSSLAYLTDGLVFVGSTMGDSQLVQIHEEPMLVGNDDDIDGENRLADTTFLSVVEEYTNLGPILDFDLVPTTPGNMDTTATAQIVQSQVVTCSGSSRFGTLRLIRNGIGMKEYASVEIPGIQNMWSVRNSFVSKDDSYLVQSFVGQTRVLGVSSLADGDEDAMQEEGGTLAEVELPGLESMTSTLCVCNVQTCDSLIQVTESGLRLIDMQRGITVDTWSPSSADLADQDGHAITVATANEAGQIVVALRGGVVVYFEVSDSGKLDLIGKRQMDREVSSLDVRPFSASSKGDDASTAMEVDCDSKGRPVESSSLVAVGLWDDFTVRLLSLNPTMGEILQINLSTEEEGDDAEEISGPQRRTRNNMMARSLCLITLDYSSTSTSGSSGGVDMLFVGLGDGTLISFAVSTQDGRVSVQARKEVSLGTQRINLIPLRTEYGGTCVLATGDRPTVIYLTGVAGTSGSQFNPKLCYSSVNLAACEEEEEEDVNRLPAQQSIAFNVAAPFFSPVLFDTGNHGSKHYSLCIADDSKLRLGVVDDIQKLHITTCRLGMTPRRIAYCADGRLFAVGCIESGINQGGSLCEEANMGNCIRFLDDTTFDDVGDRVDLEPFELISSMVYASLRVERPTQHEQSQSSDLVEKPYLLIGTAYALPDEDEPTRGRIIVISCSGAGSGDANTSSSGTRGVRQVTELQVRGAVYSMCQFYEGKILAAINSKTQICQLTDDGAGVVKLSLWGVSHHGHIVSLHVKSKASRSYPYGQGVTSSSTGVLSDAIADDAAVKNKQKAEEKEMFAIVGDLMRSISLVQYYPKHKTLEEVARDFNANWVTAVEMLTDDVYLGGDHENNLFVLRRNAKAQAPEIRCRLDTVGEYHLGEMCNKFMCGSLVMPSSNNVADTSSRGGVTARRGGSKAPISPAKDTKTPAALRARRPAVAIGSQTLFGTVDGTLGSILGVDRRTYAFFSTLERAMARTVTPVGHFWHDQYRAFQTDQRNHPYHGFVDGDLVESFLDFDRGTMESIVTEMNRDGGWEMDDYTNVAPDDDANKNVVGGNDEMALATSHHPSLTVDDVLAMVEEMTMQH